MAERGARVVDADVAARKVVLPGTKTYRSLVEHFGEEILDEDRRIDRSRLAAAVFEDEAKLSLLNSITHPAIFTKMAREIREYASVSGVDEVPAVVVDAALIADIGASAIFDIIVVVISDVETRVRRMVENRDMSEMDALARVRSQTTDEDRLKTADIVIPNDGDLDQLRHRVDQVWDHVAEKARALYP